MDNSLTYTIQSIMSKEGKQGLLALNDRIYRGSFLIKPSPPQSNKSIDQVLSSFNVINCLDLEDYLLSVVPSEMPSLWPAEALKAQTIAARSYAIANLGKNGSKGYDLKDNTEDQMYLGVRSETEQTNDAVNATKGLVLKYAGKPICAYFHSSSGGSTEAAENVWQTAVPYLKAVTDFDQEAPLYNWTKNYSISQTESGLPKDIGQVLSINVLTKGPSGRATYMLINGSNNSRIITGEAARKYFSLPSTNFNVTPAETTYTFVGKGFGHGLGLSQWGAKSLAKHGYNAAQILCYYYNGISIDY
jgi:stage II sporulation protein D